jgi:hypothetical protein
VGAVWVEIPHPQKARVQDDRKTLSVWKLVLAWNGKPHVPASHHEAKAPGPSSDLEGRVVGSGERLEEGKRKAEPSRCSG